MCSLADEKDVCVESGYLYYLHAGDNVVRYIGYTTQNPKDRMNGHRSKARSGSKAHKETWMRKHGPENIQMVVMETYPYVPVSVIKAREVELIAEYRANGYDLTNTSDGGEGAAGVQHSEEYKRAMSERLRGENSYLYGLKGEAHPAYGRKHTAESIAKMSEAQSGEKHWAYGTVGHRLGATHSEESKKLMSQNMKGRVAWNKGMKTGAKHTRVKTFTAGNHVRHHTMKNIINPDCNFCTTETKE